MVGGGGVGVGTRQSQVPLVMFGWFEWRPCEADRSAQMRKVVQFGHHSTSTVPLVTPFAFHSLWEWLMEAPGRDTACVLDGLFGVRVCTQLLMLSRAVCGIG